MISAPYTSLKSLCSKEIPLTSLTASLMSEVAKGQEMGSIL